jgi:hypothetical protein
MAINSTNKPIGIAAMMYFSLLIKYARTITYRILRE